MAVVVARLVKWAVVVVRGVVVVDVVVIIRLSSNKNGLWDRPTLTVFQTATLTQKLPCKFPVTPNHSMQTHGQPVLALTFNANCLTW